MGYGDTLGNLFLELEPMRRFREHFYIYSMPTLNSLLEALMRGYHEWGGTQAPQIAIVDWQDVPTLNGTKSAVPSSSAAVFAPLWSTRALSTTVTGISGRKITESISSTSVYSSAK